MIERMVTELFRRMCILYADARHTIAGAGRSGREALGLATALVEHAERLRETSGLAVELTVAPTWKESALTPTQRVQLFRMAQEALSNVQKHAAATQVIITLSGPTHHAVIEIADNGRGFCLGRHFNQFARRVPSWHGLIVMRDRTRALGGTFGIKSRPGQGTMITVHVPLQPGKRVPSRFEPIQFRPPLCASNAAPTRLRT